MSGQGDYWYVSFRSGGATVMLPYRSKHLAIKAALRILDDGRDVEVGPMVKPLEGNVLTTDDLQRLYRARSKSA
jgi:hypothetical protein